MTAKFFFSNEGGCLTTGGTERLRKLPKKSRKTLVVVSEAFGEIKRQFVSIPVFHPGGRAETGTFWADVITGTLYRMNTGQCLSGNSLRVQL